MNSEKLFQTQFKDYIEIAEYMHIGVDIESFWTEDYAGQTPNSGHELAIYVLWLTVVKLCWHNFMQSVDLMIFCVSIDLLTYPH